MWNDLLERNQRCAEELILLDSLLKVLEKTIKKKPPVIKVDKKNTEPVGFPVTARGKERQHSFGPREKNRKYPWPSLKGVGDYFDWPIDDGKDDMFIHQTIITAGVQWFKVRGLKAVFGYEYYNTYVRIKLLSYRRFSQEEIDLMIEEAKNN